MLVHDDESASSFSGSDASSEYEDSGSEHSYDLEEGGGLPGGYADVSGGLGNEGEEGDELDFGGMMDGGVVMDLAIDDIGWHPDKPHDLDDEWLIRRGGDRTGATPSPSPRTPRRGMKKLIDLRGVSKKELWKELLVSVVPLVVVVVVVVLSTSLFNEAVDEANRLVIDEKADKILSRVETFFEDKREVGRSLKYMIESRNIDENPFKDVDLGEENIRPLPLETVLAPLLMKFNNPGSGGADNSDASDVDLLAVYTAFSDQNTIKFHQEVTTDGSANTLTTEMRVYKEEHTTNFIRHERSFFQPLREYNPSAAIPGPYDPFLTPWYIMGVETDPAGETAPEFVWAGPHFQLRRALDKRDAGGAVQHAYMDPLDAGDAVFGDHDSRQHSAGERIATLSMVGRVDWPDRTVPFNSVSRFKFNFNLMNELLASSTLTEQSYAVIIDNGQGPDASAWCGGCDSTGNVVAASSSDLAHFFNTETQESEFHNVFTLNEELQSDYNLQRLSIEELQSTEATVQVSLSGGFRSLLFTIQSIPHWRLLLAINEGEVVSDSLKELNQQSFVVGLIAILVITLRALYSVYVMVQMVRQSNVRLSHILNSTSDAIVSFDVFGNVQTLNRATRQMFGYSEAELVKQSINRIMHKKWDELGYDLSYAAGETFGQRKHEVYFPMEVTITRFTVGKRTMYTGVLRDVTQRKEQERMLQHEQTRRQELELRLEREKVESIKKEKEAAQALAEGKARFLANMSHEIRTPLNGIIGITDLLLETELTALQLDYVNTMRMSGDALLVNVNDILDLSKIEAGKVELESMRMSLRDVIEDAMDLVSASKKMKKEVEMLIDVDDNVHEWIKGDVTRIRQIILNLLSNAIKFTEAGEITMEVSMEDTPNEDGVYDYVMRCRDTGIGMSPDRCAKLFSAFQQADATITRKYGGTGLGLMISKQLSELMGGTMWVTSEEGVGSVFHFSMKAPHAADGKPVDVEALTGKSVLVVDDNARLCDIFARQLGHWGMHVTTAVDAAKATKLFTSKEKANFDLVIVDHLMPGMDGVKFAKRVKTRCKDPELKLVLVSNIPFPEGAAADHFKEMVMKPLSMGKFARTISGVLDPSKKRDETAKNVVAGVEQAEVALDILVVEDDKTNQKVVGRMLRNAGHEVTFADDGLLGVEAAGTKPFDLVLMDMHMPNLDGIGATEQIRAGDGPNVETLIIALTADVVGDVIQRCRNAGMDDFMTKPLRRKAVTLMVAKWTGRKHGDEPNALD